MPDTPTPAELARNLRAIANTLPDRNTTTIELLGLSAEALERLFRVEQERDASDAARELGWLIETGDHKYWNGRHANQDGFTHDPGEAVRFARFEDGERVVHWLMKEYSVFLATRQHVFINGIAQA